MIRRTLVSLLVVLTATTALFAAHETKKGAKPAMSEAAMMEAWMKAATPGEQHKTLAGLEGSWDAKVTSWMAPGKPPEVSSGTSEAKMILGGRYLEERFEGSTMGQPFSGIGYTGYDNVKKQFISTWIDSMSTAMMSQTGTGRDGVMKFSGSFTDPMTGKSQMMKSTLKITDSDHHDFEMWSPGPDGKMFKMMEIKYTRRR